MVEIEFKKVRTFSEIIQDSFLFFRMHAWSLFRVYLVIVSPVAMIASFFNMKLRWIVLQNGMKIAITPELTSASLWFYLFAILTVVLLLTTTVGYIKGYLETGKGVSVDALWKYVWQKFGVVLGATIFSGILIFLGALLLILPGIWILVPLYFVSIILLLESKSVNESFAASFVIIKGNWWKSFGLLLSFLAITLMVSLIINIPLSGMDNQIAAHQEVNPVFYAGVGLLLNLINYFVSMLTIIGMVMQYYSIKTKLSNESTL